MEIVKGSSWLKITQLIKNRMTHNEDFFFILRWKNHLTIKIISNIFLFLSFIYHSNSFFTTLLELK